MLRGQLKLSHSTFASVITKEEMLLRYRGNQAGYKFGPWSSNGPILESLGAAVLLQGLEEALLI